MFLRLMPAIAQIPSLQRLQVTTRRSPTGNSAPPSGLVVVIQNKPQENKLNLWALNNPYISGVALQIHWSDLAPSRI